MLPAVSCYDIWLCLAWPHLSKHWTKTFQEGNKFGYRIGRIDNRQSDIAYNKQTDGRTDIATA